MFSNDSKNRRAPTSAVAGFAVGVSGGLVAMYFFDSVSGKRRRFTLVQWVGGRARTGVRQVESASRTAGAQAYGVAQKVMHSGRGHVPESDVVLAHKVSSEVLGLDGIPKGRISVNAEDGVVTLRGEIDDSSVIERVESETRKVTGVHDVVNLLHAPGTPAPNKAAAQRAGRS